MSVSILKQRDYLIASVQSALTDTEVVELRDSLLAGVAKHRSRGVIVMLLRSRSSTPSSLGLSALWHGRTGCAGRRRSSWAFGRRLQWPWPTSVFASMMSTPHSTSRRALSSSITDPKSWGTR